MKIDHTTTETACDGLNRVPFSPQAAPGLALPVRRPRTLRPRANQLAHDIRGICRRNPQGAHRAQKDRLRTLLLCAKRLDRRKKVVNLTADDIRLLVDNWHANKLASSTIRFRLICLRWLALKIAKPQIVGSDRSYGVDRRMT